MIEPAEVMRTSRRAVVWDFPSRDVPDALTRAGLEVMIYGGPSEADVVASELVDGQVVSRPVGRRPEQADLLYVYRPLSELDTIVAEARRMGVRTIWRQPPAGENEADALAWRSGIEAAGLGYLDAPDVVEVVRTLDRT